MIEKCIIAAVADNGAIGRGNALVWHISGDMKYFRKRTGNLLLVVGNRDRNILIDKKVRFVNMQQGVRLGKCRKKDRQF